ncbi:CGNR zinc finger domain-containing protein [Streptomyces sp. NPDC005708]|uniref:CGNR zinc finger domain-containing protein n=1 Tax=Streptomyces sp. NPDC005708 TaxID=3154564 RepID=UPI003406BB17
MRPCLAPNCLLFFVKNHARREWCSPACGNRVRVARHYRRHHPAPRAKGYARCGARRSSS